MNCWRITKYDPAFRNERGAYLRDEWTSFSDIGKSFDGEVLTLEEYRRIESAYVSTGLRFLSESGFDELAITYLETRHASTAPDKTLRGIKFDPKMCREGMVLSGENLADVSRLVLREVIWCKLEFENTFYLHFGYDYYMYVGSSASCPESISLGKQLGLFVEEMASPYLSDERT